MRSDLPSGTVTFCFTDVEGSTRLLHELGAEGYAEALAEHRRLIRTACSAERGAEVDTQGDRGSRSSRLAKALPTEPSFSLPRLRRLRQLAATDQASWGALGLKRSARSATHSAQSSSQRLCGVERPSCLRTPWRMRSRP
jgi:hypothetical protein